MVIGWYYGYTRTVEAGFLKKKKIYRKKLKKNLKKFQKYKYHGWTSGMGGLFIDGYGWFV